MTSKLKNPNLKSKQDFSCHALSWPKFVEQKMVSIVTVKVMDQFKLVQLIYLVMVQIWACCDSTTVLACSSHIGYKELFWSVLSAVCACQSSSSCLYPEPAHQEVLFNPTLSENMNLNWLLKQFTVLENCHKNLLMFATAIFYSTVNRSRSLSYIIKTLVFSIAVASN